MTFFDFNNPFQVTIEETKTFMGRGKIWCRREVPSLFFIITETKRESIKETKFENENEVTFFDDI